MTILNSFAQSADGIAEHIGKYFVTRDPEEITGAIEMLQEQIVAFQKEQAEPMLQETSVTLTRLTGEGLLAEIQKNNALCLRNEEYLADGPILEGKLLRVKPYADLTAEDTGIFLTKVTLCTNEALILAPVVAS